MALLRSRQVFFFIKDQQKLLKFQIRCQNFFDPIALLEEWERGLKNIASLTANEYVACRSCATHVRDPFWTFAFDYFRQLVRIQEKKVNAYLSIGG